MRVRHKQDFLDEKQKEKIVSLYASGIVSTFIATRFNVSGRMIRRIVMDQNNATAKNQTDPS